MLAWGIVKKTLSSPSEQVPTSLLGDLLQPNDVINSVETDFTPGDSEVVLLQLKVR